MGVQEWPALPYEEWHETRDTLHMYAQVLGKLRLALSPFEPEWGNVALYVTARGLTTSPLPVARGTIDAELDLVDHVLVLRSSAGVERRPLGGAVADFYQDTMSALRRLGAQVDISVLPSEVPDPVPFPDDRTHATYEPDQASGFFQALSAIDVVFKRHHAGFRGRSTPVHFFWGSFDLALTRFSGKPLSPPPGADMITRYSSDAEDICVGWWPGDARFPSPAFYSYSTPKPDGIEHASIAPAGAGWNDAAGEFILSYEAARTGADPPRAVLDFLESTYARSAELLGWDRHQTEVVGPPAAARKRR